MQLNISPEGASPSSMRATASARSFSTCGHIFLEPAQPRSSFRASPGPNSEPSGQASAALTTHETIGSGPFSVAPV